MTAVEPLRLHDCTSPSHTRIAAAARVALRCRRCRLLPQLLAVAAAAAATLCDRAGKRRSRLGLKAEPARQVNLTFATTFVAVKHLNLSHPFTHYGVQQSVTPGAHSGN